MATLAANGTGNWSSASLWSLCDSASFVDNTNTNTTTLTTSYTNSATFTPGAITIDGIGIRIGSRLGTTGTLTIALDQAGTDVSGTVVTINVSQLDPTNNGWFFFKFASPVTLIAATLYSVKYKTSTASQVALSSTAANSITTSARYLRTTTTQAPTTSDTIIIAGDSVASTSIVVTMDSVVTTAYGAIYICKYATLQYGVATSTNYYLKLGNFTLFIYSSATLTIGTVSAPIPASSSAVLELSPGSAVSCGIICSPGSTFKTYGNAGTFRTTLTGSHSAGATVITLNSTADMVAGNTLTFATTTTTLTQTETKTILTVDSGTQVTLSAGLTNTHAGGAEVIVNERNVKIRSSSSTLFTYLQLTGGTTANASTYSLFYTELYYLGDNTVTKRGVYITAPVDIEYCSLHDFNANFACVFTVDTGNSAGTCTISHNNISNTVTTGLLNLITGNTNVLTYTDNWHINTGSTAGAGDAINIGTVISGNNFSNNTFITCGGGTSVVSFNASGQTFTYPSGTFDYLTIRASRSGIEGVRFLAGIFGTMVFGNWSIGDSLNHAIEFTSTGTFYNSFDLTFNNITASNLNNKDLFLVSNIINGQVTVKSGTFTGPSTAIFALVFSGITMVGKFTFIDCTGSNVGNLVNDTVTTGNKNYEFLNCNITVTSTEVSFSPSNNFSYAYMENYNQVAGNYKITTGQTTVTKDTTIYHTASPSIRYTRTSGSSSGAGPILGSFKVPVASGSTATVSIYARGSSTGAGDATSLGSGVTVDLVLKANPGAGVYSDTVIATFNNATLGTWQLLSGTSPTVTDNCILDFGIRLSYSGTTTGWVNIDDFSATASPDSSEMSFSSRGEPTTLVGTVTPTLQNNLIIHRRRKVI